MPIQNLDFGTSAKNDGDTLEDAFDKIQDNFVALYAADGTVTHAITDVASAATCDIGAAATDRVRITGTTTITSLGTSASKLRFVHFAAALTLTHNATSLICIGGASIVTVAGDVCILSSDASGNWRMLSFNRGASLATGDFSGPASSTDNAIVRFDSTTGKIGQNSGVIISDTNDITGYDATNDGNPEWRIGAADAEELHVQTVYDSGAQTLNYVLFTTDVASATADKGLYRFNVDGTDILDIDDGGINFAASKGISIAGTDIITDAAGTATLSNIDALDATTEATIEAAIDTLANLTSVQGQTLTLAGAFITSGANSLTLTTTGATNVTLPTTGTLATLAGTETLSNKVLTLPQINDTSSDHQYIFAVSELAADRTVTLPLLAGNDTFVFEAFTQTLTNKTLALGSNTVSGTIAQFNTAVTDADFATLAGSETLTNKVLTSPVLTTPQINDTSADHQYVFAVSELAADRTVTLPLLAAADTFVFEAHTATLTNKTVDLTSNTLVGSVTEFNTALESADFGTWAAGATDNAAVRSDGTGGLLQTSALIIGDTADLTAYDATNDGNPIFAFGASAAERLTITPTYDTGAQTLSHVIFATDVASATADKGLFRFSPDGVSILDIDDGGINFAASKGISIAGTDILTDSAGTATLSNIDALDATTEATIEAAIDTLANLTSIQGLTVTYADAGFDVLRGWDDSAAANKNLLLADILTEAAPAAGDFVIIYGAEGDVRKANWSSLPGAGAGISNVVEDTSPELGGDLESNNFDIKMEQFSADAVAPDIYFQKSRNAAIGSHTIVQDGDDLGKIIFQGSNGTGFDSAAQIRGEVDGTPGAATDMPGRLVFSTTADGSATLTDRVILDSAGAFKPVTTDAVSLGTSALNFSDLFLDSGAVINFDSGDVTITHSANALAIAGGVTALDAASTVGGAVIKAAGVETIWIPAGAMKPKVTNGAGQSTYDSGTNDVTIATIDFDTTTQEYAHTLPMGMPKSWNESTVTAVFYWTNTGGASTETVRWSIAGAAISDDDTLNATMGTAVTVDDTWLAQNDLHISAATSAVTIGGTPAENDLVIFEISRVTGSDNMAGDARLIGVKILMTTNASNDA